MDLIIQAILRIFEAVFEKDTARRRGQTQDKEPTPPKAKKPRRTLEEWLAENLEKLEQEMAPEAPARPAPRVPPPKKVKPTPPPAARPVAKPATAPMAIDDEIVSPLQTQKLKKSRALGDGTAHDFVLPGKTDLEKMIFAQTILGPCKALEDETPVARF